jgi:hypothetical protein
MNSQSLYNVGNLNATQSTLEYTADIAYTPDIPVIVIPAIPQQTQAPAAAAMESDIAQTAPTQSNIGDRLGRLPTVAEQIADQIMLVADGCYANGAVGGLNRQDFEATLRLALRRLMQTNTDIAQIEAVEDPSETSSETNTAGQKRKVLLGQRP